MIIKLLSATLLLLGLRASAQPLEFPESPRLLGMSGAMVGLGDDALSSLRNPAGVGTQSRIAYEMSFGYGTSRGTDRFSIANINPQSDYGGRFGAGVWSQGLLRSNQCAYVVPYSTTAWSFAGAAHAGMTLRFPLHLERAACPDLPKLAVADMGVLFAPNSYRVGAMCERLLGGGAGIIPRRLHWGAAVVPDARVAVSYQWSSAERAEDFKFHFASSNIGSEILVGDYLALRGGYRWATQHHVSFGVAVGTLSEGWRLEAGWDVPTAKHGETRWATGMSYYAGGKKR